jgi:hypothetical protein
MEVDFIILSTLLKWLGLRNRSELNKLGDEFLFIFYVFFYLTNDGWVLRRPPLPPCATGGRVALTISHLVIRSILFLFKIF